MYYCIQTVPYEKQHLKQEFFAHRRLFYFKNKRAVVSNFETKRRKR